MNDLYLILALAGALAIAVLGARDALWGLREDPVDDGLKGTTGSVLARPDPPRWWLWGGPLWRAWGRADFASWLVVTVLVPVIGLSLIDAESELASTVETVVGWLLVLALGLGFSTAILGRPKILVPARLRSSPNLVTEWLGWLVNPEDPSRRK